MKIKNLKVFAASMGLTAAILTGCSGQSSNSSNESKESLETIHSFHMEEVNEPNMEEKKPAFQFWIEKWPYREEKDSCSLCIYFNKFSEQTTEPTEELYEEINCLLKNDQCNTLSLYGLGNEINFSKLDLSNICSLELDQMEEDFQWGGLENLKLNSLLIYEYRNYGDDSNYRMAILEALANSNLDLSQCTLEINVLNPTETTYAILSSIHAQTIVMNHLFDSDNLEYIEEPNHKPLQCVVNLDETVENFEIRFSNLVGNTNVDLGAISITSSNQNLAITLAALGGIDVNITKDTQIQVPDDAQINLYYFNKVDREKVYTYD